MSATMRRVAVVLATLALLAGACGDDDEPTTDVGVGPTDEDGSEEPDSGTDDGGLTVTVTSDGVEVPSEIVGGVVEVTVDNGTGSDELEVGFARVQPGTSEDAFRTAISTAFEGGPIDELIGSVSGVATGAGSSTATVILEPGEYFVVTQVFSGEDSGGEDDSAEGGDDSAEGEGDGGASEESTMFVAPMTVTEGEGGIDDIPENDGTVTALDYSFEIDVQAGDTFTFRNDGPNQFHHAVLFGFGDIDPAVVEENIKGFLEAEGPEDTPEALAGIEGDPFVGGSAVFSPGLGGTFQATLESGNTYAAVCFIGDRAGSPPHAFAYDMFEVFTVE